MQPHILHVCTTPEQAGGIWKYISYLTGSPLTEKYRFSTIMYPRRTRCLSAGVITELGKAVRCKAPDLVHIHGLQADGFHVALAVRCYQRQPVLLSVHGFASDNRYSPIAKRIVSGWLLEPLTILMADGVYTVSNYGSKKAMVRCWAKNNYGTIPNAVIPPTVDIDPKVARKRLGFEGDEVIALCVGRMTREKGMLLLAQALEFIDWAHVPSLRLMMAGQVPFEQQVKAALEPWMEKGLIRIHGQESDMWPLYRACDFLLHPSLHENQSLAILEAMAAAKPVVCMEVGGNPEIVLNEETGVLVPLQNAKMLAKVVENVAMDSERRCRLGQAGRERIEATFNARKLSEEVGKVYDHLLSDCGRI